MKKSFCLLFLVLFFAHIANSQTTNFNFTNKPISDPELPNYGRGAEFWNGVLWNGGGAPQVPSGNSSARNGYRRWWWYEMESSQGVYTLTGGYPSLEWHLKDLANQGMQLNYGSVMTSFDGGGIFYDGANSVYPQYLHNLMQAESTKDWVYTGTNSWIPNWNSPSYLARWRALQEAIYNFIMNFTYTPSSGPWAGKTVKGRDMLVTADVRGYGNFGEWHTWPWTDNTPANAVMTDSSYVKIVNATKDVFKNVPLHINVAVFDANSWADHNPFRAWYALTQRNDWGLIGYRDDGIGDPNKWFLTANPWNYNGWRADTALNNRWKYSLNTGEPLNGYGTCCPLYYDIRNQIVNKSHWGSFGNGNYPNSDQQTFDTMQAVFKLAGYRYNLNGGNMTTVLATNQNFNVALNWRNIGNAPLYQSRWRVVYQLKTAADAEVKKWTSKFRPFMYLPDSKDSVISEQFNLGNVAVGTTYKLTVKIEDSTGLCDPLFIAINSPTRNADGSYTLRSNITVSATLPVKFIDFTAVSKDKRNELNWKVTCEQTTDRFEIEKSADGKEFVNIDAIKAKNTNCVDETYTYLDYDIENTQSYYRIKQIDFDGQSIYSKTVSVRNDSRNKTVSIYPNPVENTLNIFVNDTEIGIMNIGVFSIDGKLVIQSNLLKQSGQINTTLNLKQLSSGTYIVKVLINKKQKAIEKLVKK